MNKNDIKVALVGNPNTGKTSVFNLLTGMNQHVGNYPGITVEKKMGVCKLSQTTKAIIYDLPGTYSINPSSLDESVATDFLLNKNDVDFPDVVVVVADVENLKQNLLLFTQIKDLHLPVILLLNMSDRMKPSGISIDIPELEKRLGAKIILASTRKKTGIEPLKQALAEYKKIPVGNCIDISRLDEAYFKNLSQKFPKEELYKLWLVISQNSEVVDSIRQKEIQQEGVVKTENELKKMQHKEAILRYQFINNALKDTYRADLYAATSLRARVDRLLIGGVFGYVFFLLVLLLIFQVIYNLSGIPMQWISDGFAWLGTQLGAILPEGPLSSLITQGILPGLEGIFVFVPQIALLFLFISILEESGYMSRVVFLMDRLMRPFGLSGKSVIPLMSGAACAIPAVMATRNIENWKERLITILVTPFVTCSARLPVYFILIELVIPNRTFLGFSYKGLALLCLYVLGVCMALFSAWILRRLVLLKSYKNHFIVEMPNYKLPLLRNVALTVYEKTKSFVWGAGKIIFALSVIIWFLQSHGVTSAYKNAENHTQALALQNGWDAEPAAHYLQSYQTQNSLLGNIGKAVEPIFAPLGYDWKISIGVLCSFGAREVFVSTMATIYSLGSELDVEEIADQKSIIERMRQERRPNGTPVYSLATGISLLLFYAFAMQCASTLAVVRKETNSWRWPLLQMLAMTSFAYLVALLAYQFLS